MTGRGATIRGHRLAAGTLVGLLVVGALVAAQPSGAATVLPAAGRAPAVAREDPPVVVAAGRTGGPERDLEDGDIVEQWTASPGEVAARVAAGQRTVGIIGDSIALDFAGHLTGPVNQVAPVVHNKIILASKIRDHLWETATVVRQPDGPDILVIVLGTAEAEKSPSAGRFRSDMRTMLDAVTPHVDCVWWLDTQSGPANGIYASFNRYHGRLNEIIHETVDEYSNAEYVHYSAWSELAPAPYFADDDLHPTRPAGRVGLGRVIAQAVDGCQSNTNVAGYWDMKQGYWAAGAVTWATNRGLAEGFDNDSFRAQIGGFAFDVTRGQLARMVWRLVGEPAAVVAHGWVDGPAWLQAPLDWMAENDVADGYGDGTFRAGRSITRGAVVRMLWRLSGSPVSSESHPWIDGAPWIDPALDWAYEHDLLDGFVYGTVLPTASITRAQVVSLLRKAAPLLVVPAAPVPSPVSPPTTVPVSPTTTAPVSPTTTAPVSPATTSPASPTPTETTMPAPVRPRAPLG